MLVAFDIDVSHFLFKFPSLQDSVLLFEGVRGNRSAVVL